MRSGGALLTAAVVLVGVLLGVLTGVLPPTVLLIAAVGVCASIVLVGSRPEVGR